MHRVFFMIHATSCHHAIFSHKKDSKEIHRFKSLERYNIISNNYHSNIRVIQVDKKGMNNISAHPEKTNNVTEIMTEVQKDKQKSQ